MAEPAHFCSSETFRGKEATRGHHEASSCLSYCPSGVPIMAKLRSSTDGLNTVLSMLALGTVLCLKFIV